MGDLGTFAHDPNSQYDPDSAPNQAFNCGPTTVTNFLKFQTGRDWPINDTRRLATTVNGKGTNLAERKTMSDKRGVPAEIVHLAYPDMKRRLDGTRTFDLPVLMSRIPLSIRKRPFSGSHSVEALCAGVVNGVPGVYVNNPDFNRSRGEPSRYFIPDVYLRAAYEALGSWICVPSKARVVPTRVAYKKSCRATSTVHLRSGPGTSYSSVRLVPVGFSFASTQRETAGEAYHVAGKPDRRDWLSLAVNGRLVWVAQAFTQEI